MNHDTEPDSAPPAPDPDGDRTEPGPPPSVAGGRRPTGLAADLLEHLSDAPLPEEGIAETRGHDAAQFAAGAHAPPRRANNEDAIGPSVVLNVTAPLRRGEPTVEAGEIDRTVVTRGRASSKSVLLPIALAAALLLGASVVAIMTLSTHRDSTPAPRTSALTASAASSSFPAPHIEAVASSPPAISSPVSEPSARVVLPRASAARSASVSSSARQPAIAPPAVAAPTSSYNRFLEDERK